MRTVFADSYYFFALLNLRDPAHAKAVAFTGSYMGRLITTGWILTELADGWARPAAWRAVFIQLLADIGANPNVTVVPCTDQLMNEGIQVYSQRPDKEWSLTDCISFVVMQQQKITESLTGDRHFEQAGFVALLR